MKFSNWVVGLALCMTGAFLPQGCGAESRLSHHVPMELEASDFCRGYPSEFVEVRSDELVPHTCRFDDTNHVFICTGHKVFHTLYYYDSRESFLDEGNRFGDIQRHLIEHWDRNVLVTREKLDFDTNHRLRERIVKQVRDAYDSLVERFLDWDSTGRPVMGMVDLRGLSAQDRCDGMIVTVDYNDVGRSMTKRYTGGRGSLCSDMLWELSFDSSGHVYRTVFLLDGVKVRTIRRGDVMAVDKVCL